jgi:hypothetical protein
LKKEHLGRVGKGIKEYLGSCLHGPALNALQVEDRVSRRNSVEEKMK